jgi:hypothetical protein
LFTGLLGHYTRSLHLCDRLAQADPTHTEGQRDLSNSLNRVGDVLVSRGDTDAALGHYTRSLHIAERLAQADPTNTGWQRNLSISLYKVASAHESAGLPSAVDHWTKAHHILVALDAAGRLPASDRQFLDYVTGKLGLT